MRRAYIDWLRGIAVLCMIEWHVLDAWSLPEGRDTFAWDVIGSLGGVAAPLFLFLAGLAVPLAGEARLRRGATPVEAAWALQKRGWQIFALAHVFRFQSFLLNPNAAWHALLKPDILNILGLGLVLAAWCWGRSRTVGRPGLWLIGPAIVVLALTPFAPLWAWPDVLHPRLEAYIRPVGGYGVFTLFPAIAFVFVGAYIGDLLAIVADEAGLQRRLAAAGVVAVAIGVGVLWVPETMNRVHFWSSAAALFVWKTGTLLLMVAGAWLFARRWPPARSSPLVIFGRTSLFVYWIHVELAYGVFSYPLHHALPLGWAVVGLAAVMALMLVLARWWESAAFDWRGSTAAQWQH